MKKLKLNKKAEITAEEVVKMVIAIVCIIILIALAAGLYGIFTTKSKLEQAKETLTQISAVISGFEESGNGDVLITSPKEWYLVSNDNNLCLCDSIAEGIIDCCNKGAKKEVVKEVIVDGECAVYNALSKDEYIHDCFEIYKVPISINLVNYDDSLHLRENAPAASSDLLTNILEFKEGDKSVKNNLEVYVKTWSESSKDEIKKQIANYFINVKNVKEGNFEWTMMFGKDSATHEKVICYPYDSCVGIGGIYVSPELPPALGVDLNGEKWYLVFKYGEKNE
jgi:hypothetical protein